MEPYFLYVEDDEDDVVLLREMMRQTGFLSPFAVANNGFEAIRFLQGIKSGAPYPFMILLDIEMPRLNGRETLSLLKSDDMYCLIPVVMFSEATKPETIQYFARKGTEVLSKPIEFNGWKKTIQKISSFADF
jgi:two-component system, response regulator